MQYKTNEEVINKYGSKITVIEYNSWEDVVVKFDNGYIKTVRYDNFKSGHIVSPYCKTVIGVGFVGEGVYKLSENGYSTRVYQTWKDMLIRCYCEKYLKNKPTYRGCTVCDEWHNFQNFAKWYSENYYKIPNSNQRIQIDKDILIKGNKIYSPNTCIFVPEIFNNITPRVTSLRGVYPIGVHVVGKRFRAICTLNHIKYHIGMYDNVNDAFEAYKNFKENKIMELLYDYKDILPSHVFNAILNYKIEITD